MIVGIDEAGRGCWAGPLVAAAVLLTKPIEGLGDSKTISKRKREQLELLIKENTVYGIGWVWPDEIDRIGLTAATTKAMSEALAQITADHTEVVIDGNLNYIPTNPKVKTVIKADSLVPAVSAASILAKVARDRYMEEMSATYPQYHFEKHVGYGTALHIATLAAYGVSPIHRLSYKPVKKFLIVKP
jgi:ribonuclease HII